MTISHSEIEVQEKDNGTVRVKVSAPSSISGLGSNDLEIQITPKNLDVDDAQAETYTLVIKVCEDDILLTTEFQIIIVIIIAAVIASVFFIRWRRRKNKLKYLNN